MDVVYTWVDGGWPGYGELLARFSGEPVDLNPERYRDHFQLLRYSLRSLARFAPWVRRVFLFTARPQVPPWLNTEHPDVHVHHHDEIFRPHWVLPVFNCNVIETQLHRLPCSDPFLYLNDDYLLGAPVTPEFFCHPQRGISVHGTLVGEAWRQRVQDKGLSLGFTEHAPLWVDKTHWENTLWEFPDLLQATLRSRFRHPDNLRMERAYRYYLLARTRPRRPVRFPEALRTVCFHKIKNEPEDQKKRLARLDRQRPPLVCLNDDQGDHPDPQVVAMVQELLQRWYPDPSPWERPE